MIMDESRKSCVFLNPKTGTNTLSEIFKDAGFDHTHEHPNYEKLENYQGYTLHCFCRDPVDRFLSCLNYEYQTRQTLVSYLVSNFSLYILAISALLFEVKASNSCFSTVSSYLSFMKN